VGIAGAVAVAIPIIICVYAVIQIFGKRATGEWAPSFKEQGGRHIGPELIPAVA
jgi:hypothetical protein